MTDSNVVTYPHVEDQEMGKVKEIFDRALNALVSASSLAKDVETLKNDLEQLKHQVTHYRNTISNQDDQITRLRQDRDAARTAQYQAEDSARHLNNEITTVKRDSESLASANVRLNERVSELSKERDDAQFKLLELQEAHTALATKLESIKKALGIVDKEPEPVSTVSVPVQEPEPVRHEWDVISEPEVTAVLESQPVVNPPEPSPPETYPSDISRS